MKSNLKKTKKIIELLIIIIISIIIYNQTIYIVKDKDKLLTEIKNREEQYYIKPQDAIIKDETIITGINGKKIDIEKTYDKMKKLKTFNEKYIIYKEIKPKINIENNKNKYIIGSNNRKKEIGIIIEIKELNDAYNIVKILKNNDTNVTFQITNNDKKILKIIKNDANEIENNNPLKSNKICIIEEPNKKILTQCSKLNKYTVIPKIIIKKDLLIQTKKEIEPGKVIKIYANNNTIKELDIAIKYIKSKGIKIKKISELISEKNNE